MQLIWVDDSFPEKEKNNNNDHLDNSRTTDTISHINNQDDFSQMENIENNNISTLNKRVNNKNDEERLVIDNFENKRIKNNNIFFKKRLSIILCIIYFILFLICIPKIAIKIGEEQNIDVLIENNSNEKINILINQIVFCDECDNKHKSSGYILEFRINKMYILRWFIGFFYFIIKCICFIYSNPNNNHNYFLDNNKINLIQKASMLFFPLSLFYYDLKNNLSISEIKSEKIDKKIISFYIETTKTFYLIDYVEGLIPTLFYFLISIDYDKFDKIINLYHIKRSKLNKLV